MVRTQSCSAVLLTHFMLCGRHLKQVGQLLARIQCNCGCRHPGLIEAGCFHCRSVRYAVAIDARSRAPRYTKRASRNPNLHISCFYSLVLLFGQKAFRTRCQLEIAETIHSS